MNKIKFFLIWICLKINVRLVFNIKYTLTKESINVDFNLRDWCKNAI